MPAAVPIVSAAAGVYSGYKQSQAAKKSSQAQAQAMRDASAMMSPQQVMSAARTYNPYIFNALMSPQQGASGLPRGPVSPFQQSLNNIAQNPGFIDPALMNQSYTQAQRGSQQGLLSAQGMLGRSGMEGGLGDAYALANQAGLTGTRANLAQGYALWREQNRRSDIDMLMNMYNQAINQGAGGQAQMANTYGGSAPYMQGISNTGNMIGAGLGAMGGIDWSQFAKPKTTNVNIGAQQASPGGWGGGFGGQWGGNLFGGQNQRPYNG